MEKKSIINNQRSLVRYMSTLVVNIIRMGLGLIGGIIIARSLGPSEYGNYNFLLGSFVSILAFFDMGSSSAFYTFLSQKRMSARFHLFYYALIGAQFLVILMLIMFFMPGTWFNKVWLGHTRYMVLMAFIASFVMNRIWETVSHSGESIRSTVIVQIYNIVISGLYLIIVIALAFLKLLTLPALFATVSITYVLISFILTIKLRKNLIVKEEDRMRDVMRRFRDYCAPLVIYGVISSIYMFSDVWLLQRFGGSIHQGFYSVGLRFSAICLIATASIIKIFWKEIAEANERGDKKRIAYLYNTITRVACFVGAVISCFLIPFSKWIIVTVLGPQYEGGWVCLSIMFLFPIHQALAQITNTYFYATSQTRLRTKLGGTMMMISIFITYFVLASPSAMVPGLGLGSIGLASKTVLLQIVHINVLAYFISRLSGWKFNFVYQFQIIGILLTISILAKIVLERIFAVAHIPFSPLGLFVSCLPIYMLAVGIIISFCPQLCGLDKKRLKDFFQFLKPRF